MCYGNILSFILQDSKHFFLLLLLHGSKSLPPVLSRYICFWTEVNYPSPVIASSPSPLSASLLFYFILFLNFLPSFDFVISEHHGFCEPNRGCGHSLVCLHRPACYLYLSSQTRSWILEEQMIDLKNLSEDVKTRVELAEQQNMRATRTVKGWLRKIDLVEVDVDRILQQGDLEVENKCLGSCFPKNFR